MWLPEEEPSMPSAEESPLTDVPSDDAAPSEDAAVEPQPDEPTADERVPMWKRLFERGTRTPVPPLVIDIGEDPLPPAAFPTPDDDSYYHPPISLAEILDEDGSEPADVPPSETIAAEDETAPAATEYVPEAPAPSEPSEPADVPMHGDLPPAESAALSDGFPPIESALTSTWLEEGAEFAPALQPEAATEEDSSAEALPEQPTPARGRRLLGFLPFGRSSKAEIPAPWVEPSADVPATPAPEAETAPVETAPILPAEPASAETAPLAPEAAAFEPPAPAVETPVSPAEAPAAGKRGLLGFLPFGRSREATAPEPFVDAAPVPVADVDAAPAPVPAEPAAAAPPAEVFPEVPEDGHFFAGLDASADPWAEPAEPASPSYVAPASEPAAAAPAQSPYAALADEPAPAPVERRVSPYAALADEPVPAPAEPRVSPYAALADEPAPAPAEQPAAPQDAARLDEVRRALSQPTEEFPVILPVGAPNAYDQTAVMPVTEPRTIFDQPAREVEDQAPRLSPLLAVVRVIALPRSTFDRAAEEGLVAWPAALVIVLLSAIIKTGLAIGFAARGAVPDAALPAVAVRYGVSLAGPLLAAVAVAGWIVLVQRTWEGDGRYNGVLSAVSLALVPLALRNLLQAGFMAATQQVLVHPGLSAFVAPPSTGVLGRIVYGALGGIDVFVIWAFVLMVVATRVTHGRGRLRPALMLVLFAVIALVLVTLPGYLVAPLLRF
jgi:hypothetical protein